MPNCFVSERAQGIGGESFLLGLEFLETYNVRLRFSKSSQNVIQPLVDVVDVEGGGFHEKSLAGDAHPLRVIRLPVAFPMWAYAFVLCGIP